MQRWMPAAVVVVTAVLGLPGIADEVVPPFGPPAYTPLHGRFGLG